MSRSARKSALSDPGPPMSPLPPPTQPLSGKWQAFLVLLLALYIALTFSHSRVVPVGYTGLQNAPDEAAHIVNVRVLASGHLPTQQTAASDPQGYEWHQPPLYYWLGAWLLPWGTHGVRLLSIACGLGCLFLLFRAARLLMPADPSVAVFAVGLSALIPGHIANTSTVNNDPLLELCFSAVLLILVASFRGGFTLWRAGWLGLFAGLACLTKSNGILLIPIVCAGVLLLIKNGENRLHVVRSTVWAGAVFLLTCGWWYIRNWQIYGELLPFAAFQRAFAGTAQADQMVVAFGGWGAYFLRVLQWTFQSFWAVYGTVETARVGFPLFLPEQVYLLFVLFLGAVLAGLVKMHLRRKSDFTETQQYVLWLLFGTIALVGLSFVGFVAKYFQTQGRYLYPAMLPLCLVMSLGWRAILPLKYRQTGNLLVLLLLGALSVAFIGFATPKG